MTRRKAGTGRWLWGTGVALGVHALFLLVLWLSAPVPEDAVPEPVPVELWYLPQLESPPKLEAVPERSEAPPSPTKARPRPAVIHPVPVIDSPVPESLPISPSPPAPPKAEAGASGTGVTPRAYPEGGDKGRAGLTRALLKRDLCIQQRNAGKPMDKDCPVSPPRDIDLPNKPPENRPTKLCLAERERQWDKYRNGTGAYPGLNDLINGKKKCRQGWDDD
ncbi:hypothetical protein PQU92_09640 [Asticcacaulis sp. BYS171W]|uniref:Uncharacterized protein n=1 Tax=Asticcacaulis aquaticus TaxID=2984212 RepID=A0ABT5HTY8_9CAUL|nr:hypothetical protein [Asticcacaulis aquaticus]MDC7683538.1 hypothetical protein [Asticcacaulis aquaticus]